MQFKVEPAKQGWCGTVGCHAVADWEIGREVDDTTWVVRLACDVHTTPAERGRIADTMGRLLGSP